MQWTNYLQILITERFRNRCKDGLDRRESGGACAATRDVHAVLQATRQRCSRRGTNGDRCRKTSKNELPRNPPDENMQFGDPFCAGSTGVKLDCARVRCTIRNKSTRRFLFFRRVWKWGLALIRFSIRVRKMHFSEWCRFVSEVEDAQTRAQISLIRHAMD